MKITAYGVLVDRSLILNRMAFEENTASEIAHKVNYDRFYKDDIKLAKLTIEIEVIKQISQPKDTKDKKPRRKLKKRRSLKRRGQ